MTLPIEPFIFLLLVFSVYGICLFGPFMFDDRDGVLGNRHFQAKDWISPLYKHSWRGLTVSSWAFNHKLCAMDLECQQCRKTLRGARPWSFRAINYILHALNAWQVTYLAGLFHVEQPWVAGLFFAVGPFAVYSVSYITARASILSALFGLMGLNLILSGYELYAIPILMLAFWAKEDGAAFAITYGVVSFISGGMWWIWVIPPLGIFLVMRKVILRMFTAEMTGSENMMNGGLPGALPQPQHAITVFVENILHYPLFAFGIKNTPYHGSGIPVPSPGKTLAAFALYIGCVLGAAFYPSLQMPLILALVGPSLLYMVFLNADILMEYRNYHSSVGIALLLALLSPLIAIPLAIRTLYLAKAASSPSNFWARCIKSGSGEKSRAWQEWASEQRERRNLKEARTGYMKALELNPKLCPARQNLSWLNMQEGQPEEAQKQVRICTDNSPLQSSAWMDRGLISEKNGLLDEAHESYIKAVELRDISEEGWNRRGVVAFAKQQYEEAVECWTRTRELAPHIGDYIWNLHWALKMTGDNKEADKMIKLLPKEIPMTDNMVQPPEAKVRLGT